MQATKDNIIIKPFLVTGGGGYETKGGIYIPEQVENVHADKACAPQALVISIGPEVDEVNEGDTIIYNKFGAKQLGPEYEELFQVNINEVYGIVTVD